MKKMISKSGRPYLIVLDNLPFSVALGILQNGGICTRFTASTTSGMAIGMDYLGIKNINEDDILAFDWKQVIYFPEDLA